MTNNNKLSYPICRIESFSYQDSKIGTILFIYFLITQGTFIKKSPLDSLLVNKTYRQLISPSRTNCCAIQDHSLPRSKFGTLLIEHPVQYNSTICLSDKTYCLRFFLQFLCADSKQTQVLIPMFCFLLVLIPNMPRFILFSVLH